jgi:hypothetical protein
MVPMNTNERQAWQEMYEAAQAALKDLPLAEQEEILALMRMHASMGGGFYVGPPEEPDQDK